MAPPRWTTSEELEWLQNELPEFLKMQKDQKLTCFYELLFLRWFSLFPERVTNWDGITSNSEKTQMVCWEVLQCPEEDKVKVQGTRSEYNQGFSLKDKSKRFYENRD
ncbi:hypothetical protein BDR07DRAFT_1458680 [Suillus spraguei]|nr:hypothetical protein BDR07DRAFT_1458680 [Suillus spraguei]